MRGYLRGKPDLGYWTDQIGRGDKYRARFAMESKWPTWRAYYRGNWHPSVLPTNLFFRMVRSTVPRLYFRNPSVSVSPAKPGLVHMALAKIMERADNKMLLQMKVKQEMKMVTQDTFLFGTGVGKLGFGAQFTPVPQEGGTFRPRGSKGEIFEYSARVMDNMPWFARVHPGNFVIPDGCQNLDYAPWVGEWMVRHREDVEHDPMLENNKNLRRGGGSHAIPGGRISRRHDRDPDELDLLEIRDKKFGRVFLFAPFHSERPLFFGDDIMQIGGGVPYFAAIFNPDDEVFWGIPDSNILEPQQLEANETRTLIMKHRRLSLVRFLVRNKGMTIHEAAKLVGEKVGAVAWTDDDPDTVVKVLNGLDIPAALLQNDQLIREEVRESLGFSRNQMGDFSETRSHSQKTAEEVATVREAAEIRVDERRDVLADMLVEMVQQMHILMFEQWNTSTVIDVIGPAGIPLWVQFRPDILRQGAYDVKVDPDNSFPMTKGAREQRALTLYQQLATNPLINPYGLTQYLLHEMHGVQFDQLLVGLPPGTGVNPEQPLSIDQFAGVLGRGQQLGLPQLPQLAA